MFTQAEKDLVGLIGKTIEDHEPIAEEELDHTEAVALKKIATCTIAHDLPQAAAAGIVVRLVNEIRRLNKALDAAHLEIEEQG